MNRFFLQVIIYFCSIYCCIILTASQNVSASTTNESKQPAKSDKAELDKSSQPGRKKAARNSNRMPVLVPPPPPEQTSLLDWSNLSFMPESFNLLNQEELKQKLSNLRKEITNAQLALEENNAEAVEAKDKAERFDSLYSEGVVSRKELEIVRRQVCEKERLAQEKKGRVQDLKAQENAILRHLASLKKNNKSKQAPKKISNGKKN